MSRRAPLQVVVCSWLKARAVPTAVGTMVVLLVGAALSLPDGASRSAEAAAGSPALLQIVQNGGINGGTNQGGKVVIEGPDRDPVECVEGFYPNRNGDQLLPTCEFDGFLQGQTVTLTATAVAPGVAFKGWSDERCPPGPVAKCMLTLAAEQTVVALFSPLPIDVRAVGDGTLTITDSAGRSCRPRVVAPEVASECPRFDVPSTLTLVASANPACADVATCRPRFNPDHCDGVQATADRPVSTCTLSMIGVQQVGVSFDSGQPPPDAAPPRRNVIFRARAIGPGTVRGDFDCGSRCAVTVRFGKRVSLVAEPAAGARFVGWKGGCGTDRTCTLQATATAVAAEFAPAPRPDPSPPPPPPPPPGPNPNPPAFTASVGKVTPTGRRSRRRIVIPVRVSRPAFVRATLSRAGRRVATRLFSVPRGSSRVRLTVPRRARAGRHRLRITIRDAARRAPAVTFRRSVRLPR